MLKEMPLLAADFQCFIELEDTPSLLWGWSAKGP